MEDFAEFLRSLKKTTWVISSSALLLFQQKEKKIELIANILQGSEVLLIKKVFEAP